MEDDEALLQFLTQLESYGVALVKKAPLHTGQIHTLTPRVVKRSKCFLSQTRVTWLIPVLRLNSILTLTSRYYKPEIQLLHCISQTQVKEE
ncbi:hypothetical protein Pmani_025070 [Petrolisthes manimaculis]|uniref:Uncharacterized protein n=1 Tax=Petrolisthes manimaculis TaxID=1843537 RepID=A0AAE1P6B4_9EUCA|nr:hypothetical protein Pmani_025070 [Petrolisthes manimaculis]